MMYNSFMDEYGNDYVTYLHSTSAYNNLVTLKTKIEELTEKLEALKDAYNEGEGNYVNTVCLVIIGLKATLDSYHKMASIVINGLDKNAESFNRCYAKWKEKDLSAGYKSSSNANYGDKVFFDGEVYINNDGYVESRVEYGTSNNRNFGQEVLNVITFGVAYMSGAGESYETKTATDEEMLSS